MVRVVGEEIDPEHATGVSHEFSYFTSLEDVDDVDRACLCERREARLAGGPVGTAASGGGRLRTGQTEE